MITALAFYLFSAILLISAGMVITSRNPVHSVLFLILAFFNAAALFLIAGAEFLAMILVIVYVGAVAVLFLFVVMMLDVNFSELRDGFQRYAPIGAAVGAVLFGELALVLGGWRFAPEAGAIRMSSAPGELDNTRALGHLIYTDYVFLFQSAGLILMVAMIGAIVLTHRDRGTTKRQSIAKQNARVVSDTLELVKVASGAGVTSFLRPKSAAELVGADQAHEHGVGKPGPGEH
jgi:NADH-quinone oxidoreductase subunit J